MQKGSCSKIPSDCKGLFTKCGDGPFICPKLFEPSGKYQWRGIDRRIRKVGGQVRRLQCLLLNILWPPNEGVGIIRLHLKAVRRFALSNLRGTATRVASEGPVDCAPHRDRVRFSTHHPGTRSDFRCTTQGPDPIFDAPGSSVRSSLMVSMCGSHTIENAIQTTPSALTLDRLPNIGINGVGAAHTNENPML